MKKKNSVKRREKLDAYSTYACPGKKSVKKYGVYDMLCPTGCVLCMCPLGIKKVSAIFLLKAEQILLYGLVTRVRVKRMVNAMLVLVRDVLEVIPYPSNNGYHEQAL